LRRKWLRFVKNWLGSGSLSIPHFILWGLAFGLDSRLGHLVVVGTKGLWIRMFFNMEVVLWGTGTFLNCRLPEGNSFAVRQPHPVHASNILLGRREPGSYHGTDVLTTRLGVSCRALAKIGLLSQCCRP